jgi:phage-related protein
VSGADDSAVVTNGGTADTKPYIVIHGPLVAGGWHLTNVTTGGDFKIDVGVATTDTLVLDFKNQVVTLNGALVTSTIRGDFWSVVRGTNTIKLYADYDPAVSFTVTIYSAWE